MDILFCDLYHIVIQTTTGILIFENDLKDNGPKLLHQFEYKFKWIDIQ